MIGQGTGPEGVRRRGHLLFYATGAFIFATLTVAPASAQDANTQNNQNNNSTAQLETVVITAEKRAERITDAPVSAIVVNNSDIQNQNMATIADLNNLVPSVNLFETLNGRVPLAIRGISTVSNEQTVGISSGVAIEIDGVPFPADSMGGYNLDDVARVEVLRGPQSTLGGRTASAGVINIITRGPSDTFITNGSLSVTNDDEQKLDLFESGPISDAWSFSISGWGSHTRRLQKNYLTNKHTYFENEGVRAKLQYKPSERWDALLSMRLQDSITVGSHFVYSYITPGANFFPYINGGLTQAFTLPGVKLGPTNTIYDDPVPKENNLMMNEYDTMLELNYHLNNGATITSTTGYLWEKQKHKQNLFLNAQYWDALVAPFPHPLFDNTQRIREKVSQFSEEVKLVSPSSDTFEYLGGIFYSTTKVDEFFYRPFFGNYVNIYVTPITDTLDAYGRLTFKNVLPAVDVITGLRVNYDTIKYDYNQLQYGALNAPNPFHSKASDSKTAVVGDISLQYHVNPDWTTYFTYGRGYKPIAYNTGTTLTSNAPLPPVGQEDIDNFEIGSKGQYYDNRLAVNVALFDTVYKNYQIQTFIDTGGLIRPLVLTNAGEAETKGIELDAVAAPTDTTTVTFAAAYIEAKFNKYENASCFPTQTVAQGCIAVGGNNFQDVSGKTMPVAPRLKWNASVQQTVPLADWPVDLVLNGSYQHTSKQQFQVDQNPRTVQAPFGILDLSASLQDKEGHYSLTFFINNVTDDFYVSDMEDFFAGLWGGQNAVLSQPARDAHRYIGLRLDVHTG